MNLEEINKQQEKIKKMEWETPRIVDLEAKDTESGTHGNDDGAAGWSNIS